MINSKDTKVVEELVDSALWQAMGINLKYSEYKEVQRIVKTAFTIVIRELKLDELRNELSTLC